jgi:hypothetical protein
MEFHRSLSSFPPSGGLRRLAIEPPDAISPNRRERVFGSFESELEPGFLFP